MRYDECTLQGTLAVLEWNIQVPLDVRQVYDSWPSAEGGDDDDFNFKISVSDQFKLATRPNGAEARHFVMQMLEEHDEVELDFGQ